jgi:TPR repeat protein
VSLLTKAAGKGNVRASNQIASMYAIGTCVPRDRVQAYRWLGASLAADPHNQWAQRNRDLMLSQMTTAELNRLKAER